MPSRDPHLAWTLVANPDLLGILGPLLHARVSRGPVRFVSTLDEALPGASSIFIVGGAPREIAALQADDGGSVPIGWISDRVDVLVRYVGSLAGHPERQGTPGPVALLAQWEDRSLRLADDLEGRVTAKLLRWTAERLARRDLLPALGTGLGAALYVGHGERWGWRGYGGVTSDQVLAHGGHPVGAVLSLTCKTASLDGGEPNFCDALVAGGASLAALGCVESSEHVDNRRLALALAARLGRARTLADCVRDLPVSWLKGYRISGDPAAPLGGTDGAWDRAQSVFAPHPKAELGKTGSS